MSSSFWGAGNIYDSQHPLSALITFLLFVISWLVHVDPPFDMELFRTSQRTVAIDSGTKKMICLADPN